MIIFVQQIKDTSLIFALGAAALKTHVLSTDCLTSFCQNSVCYANSEILNYWHFLQALIFAYISRKFPKLNPSWKIIRDLWHIQFYRVIYKKWKSGQSQVTMDK